MHYILITLLLLSSSISAKESDYSLIIDKPFNSELLDITQDYDRDISAIGFSKQYKKSSNTKNKVYKSAFDYLNDLSYENGSRINLVKIDNNAEIKLNKIIKLPKFNKAVSLIKTPTNGYFVGGYTNDGSLIVLKLDSNANVKFTKTFGTKNQDKMKKLIKLRDGGVVAVGSSITSRSMNDDIFKNGLGKNDIYVTKFSKDGMKVWSKKYGTIHDDQGIDAVEAEDGTIVVISTTKYDNNKNITLMRITQNGDKIWLKHYKSENVTTPHKIIRLRDGNFLISLSHKNSMNQEQIRLIKFDIHKNIIYDKDLTTTYSSALKDIKEYSNGNIVGVGYVNDDYNTDGLVMNLNKDLKLLCQDHFGGENYDLYNAATILHNSQVAVAGVSTSENSQESNMWISKVNKDCTIAQKSVSSVNIYNKLTKVFSKEIKTNKLIIQKDLSIDIIDDNLLFKSSEYNLTKTQNDFLTKFSKKLIPLLKTNHRFIDTLEVNGHTSSEWGKNKYVNQYLKNEELSMKRSFAVLSCMFKMQDIKTQKWLSKILKGSGVAYSKNIVSKIGEDKEKSRRVSFKILLKRSNIK